MKAEGAAGGPQNVSHWEGSVAAYLLLFLYPVPASIAFDDHPKTAFALHRFIHFDVSYPSGLVCPMINDYLCQGLGGPARRWCP